MSLVRGWSMVRVVGVGEQAAHHRRWAWEELRGRCKADTRFVRGGAAMSAMESWGCRLLAIWFRTVTGGHRGMARVLNRLERRWDAGWRAEV